MIRGLLRLVYSEANARASRPWWPADGAEELNRAEESHDCMESTDFEALDRNAVELLKLDPDAYFQVRESGLPRRKAIADALAVARARGPQERPAEVSVEPPAPAPSAGLLAIEDLLRTHQFSYAHHGSSGPEAHCRCGLRPRGYTEWCSHVAPLVHKAAHQTDEST